MKPAFAVVGCGRVGTAMARYLSGAGYVPAGFSSRNPESARKSAAAAGGEAPVSTDPADIAGRADIVLITTPDQAIGGTAERIAARAGLREGTVVLHCSGALSSAELAALKPVGASIGSLHPLQSFAGEMTERSPFAGIMMGIEGEPTAVAVACRMAEALGAVPFEIDTGGKVLYHAAAVVASNYLVTLMHMATRLLHDSGVRTDHPFRILRPLVAGTLANIDAAGIPHALTGPIARGDVAIVRAHLSEMLEKAPDFAPLYRILGMETIDIARAKGTLSEEAADALRAILKND